MARGRGSTEYCRSCGRDVDLETGVEITVKRDRTKTRTLLCERCATVECEDCGSDVPIRAVLPKRTHGSAGFRRVECARCDDAVFAHDAVEIRHTRNRAYRKIVCAECLKRIAIPKGYRVVRDVALDSE